MQNDAADQLQIMINALAMAGVASETLSDGLVPVVANAGKLAKEFGKLYAHSRGAAIAVLKAEYGLDSEQAIDATEGMDDLMQEAVRGFVAGYAISQQNK
jgi:hypothetical protein